MSSKVRAVILRNMKDINCMKEALEELGIKYEIDNLNCKLSNGISISNMGSDIKLSYRVRNRIDEVKLNQFAEKLTKTYEKKLEAKIRRLKLEEIKIKEKSVLDTYTEEERLVREKELTRERKRLEEIKRREELELKKKIDIKAQQIKKRAEELGYTITEQIKNKERVLVLVRRQ